MTKSNGKAGRSKAVAARSGPEAQISNPIKEANNETINGINNC